MSNLFNNLDPEELTVYEWQYCMHGSFYTALFGAIKCADEKNLIKLAAGFPIEVNGYLKYTREDGWWESVIAKVNNGKEQV